MAQYEKTDDARFDVQLDRLLASDIEKDVLENWMGRMYRCRRGAIGTVFFMKLAGIRPEDISVMLNLSVERIYRMEYLILQHYRMTLQSLAHQRICRAKRHRIQNCYL